MSPKIDLRRTPPHRKRLYATPRLTELGNIDASDDLMHVSPELKVTLLTMKEAINRDQAGG